MSNNVKRPRWSYEDGATMRELLEFWERIADIEHKERYDRDQWAAACSMQRIYKVFLDGELAGMCFVADNGDSRNMAFTKTQWLVDMHPLAFARNIPELFKALAERETKAGCNDTPMYMHTPDGDDRSKKWFIRNGCIEIKTTGLLCPVNERKMSWL